MIMDYWEYKGYKGSVEYSKEDDHLYGKVSGMGNKALILYEGSTIKKNQKLTLYKPLIINKSGKRDSNP